MAGKLIKRKEIKQWLISYASSGIEGCDDRHIDYLVYSTVKKEQWIDMTWIVYHFVVSCINKLHLDIKAGIYACIKIRPCPADNQDIRLSSMSFDIKRMPPSIFLYRGKSTDNLYENAIFSEQISKFYGMKAWLHHWDDDPSTRYYLDLMEE